MLSCILSAEITSGELEPATEGILLLAQKFAVYSDAKVSVLSNHDLLDSAI